jgi:hypothetical protein
MHASRGVRDEMFCILAKGKKLLVGIKLDSPPVVGGGGANFSLSLERGESQEQGYYKISINF